MLYGKFDGRQEIPRGRSSIIKDDDILLSWVGDASMTLGEVKCVADNVLVQVTKVEEETASGIALAVGVSEQTRHLLGW